MEIAVKVWNKMGLHARPAALLARLAGRFQAKIGVAAGDKTAAADSVLALLMLGAGYGAELRITAEGSDAGEALQEIQALFDAKFDED